MNSKERHRAVRIDTPTSSRISTPLLEALPLELIYHICSFLACPYDTLNLSYTCRALLSALGTKNIANHYWYRFFDHNQEFRGLLAKYRLYSRESLSVLVRLREYHGTPSSGIFSTEYRILHPSGYYELDRAKVFEFPCSDYNPDVDYPKKVLDVWCGEDTSTRCNKCMKLGDLVFPETWCMKLKSTGTKRAITLCKNCISDANFTGGGSFIQPGASDVPFKLLFSLDINEIRIAYVPRELRSEAQIQWTLSFRSEALTAIAHEAISNSYIGPFLNSDQGSNVLWYRPDVERALTQICPSSKLAEYPLETERDTEHYRRLGPLLCNTIVNKYRSEQNHSQLLLVSRELSGQKSLRSYLEAKWEIYCHCAGYPLKTPGLGISSNSMDNYFCNLRYGLSRIMKRKELPYYSLNWMHYYYNYIYPYGQVLDLYYNDGLDGSKNLKNVFSCIEDPPLKNDEWTQGDEERWLPMAAETFIRECLQGPDDESAYSSRQRNLKMRDYRPGLPDKSEHVTPESVELTFIERAIWQYASPKFTALHSRKAGLCRECEGDTYYTTFEYAIHIYREHPAYFQQGGKWEFRAVSTGERGGSKQAMKEIILQDDFERRSRALGLTDDAKLEVLATERYGPHCVLTSNTSDYNNHPRSQPYDPYRRMMRIKYWDYYYLY